MLVNSIVIRGCADPLIWSCAIVAMCAEVSATLLMLRRMGQNVAGFGFPLVVANLSTWLPFLVTVDWLVVRHGWGPVPTIGTLEVLIVVVEALLLRSASRGRFFSRDLPCRPIGLPQALLVSLVG